MNGAQVGLLSPSWSRTFRAAAEVQAWRPEPPPTLLAAAAALRPTAVKASAFSETAARQAVAPVRVSMRTASEEQDGGKMAATGGEETEEAEEYGQRNKNNALGLTRGRGNVHARHRR